MSATRTAPRAEDLPRSRTSAAWIPVAVGSCALLFRGSIALLPTAPRELTLLALYASILAGSLLVPVEPRRGTLSPVVAAGIGVGAVVIAAAVSGRPPPTSFAAWALPLSLLAAVAEEALFRRAAYAWLTPHGAAVAIVGSAALFALVHLPFYGVAALPVDLGAGLLFGWQRWASGSWTVPAATHASANLLAVILR